MIVCLYVYMYVSIYVNTHECFLHIYTMQSSYFIKIYLNCFSATNHCVTLKY